MPCIIIKSFKTDKPLDTEKFTKEVASFAEINVDRVNVIVDYYQDSDFYSGSLSNSPIVFIFISEKNGKDFVQKLCKVVSNLVEKHFSVPKDSIAVFCNTAREGYFLVNGYFK